MSETERVNDDSPSHAADGFRPVIGVSTYRESVAWGVWSVRADVLHAEYADSLARAGAAPVLLSPADPEPVTAGAILDRLDGLVIAGGADIDPSLYGEAPHQRTGAPRTDRDRWELELAAAAADRGTPVLGICRGMQLLAVAAGGRLHQHTPDLVGHQQHSPGGDSFGGTRVRTESGSWVASVIGEQGVVNCHHHQSVAAHPGFTPTAWAEDGTLEAMELVDAGRFCVAVQWHPELIDSAALFDSLVERSRQFGRARFGRLSV